MKNQEKFEIYRKITEVCEYILNNESIGKSTKDYLDNRIDPVFHKTFSFGYFPKDDELKYLYNFIDRKTLEDINILYPKTWAMVSSDHGHFSNHNLLLPFKDMYGNIVSLLGRSILSEEQRDEQNLQKYKYTFGSNKELYLFGIDLAREEIIKKDYVICVEGQFDFISLYTSGIKNAVAIGSASLSRYHFAQLSRYTKNIVLMLDNDEAGKTGKIKAKKKYNKYANVVSISVPNGYKDIDEFLRNADKNVKTPVIEKLEKEFAHW